MMKPLASLLLKRENEKYQKLKDSMTMEQTAKLIAKDIVKYLVKYDREVFFLVASYFDEEDFSGYKGIGYNSSLIKNRKASIGRYKFNKSVELQLMIIDELRKNKNISIERKIEQFPPYRIVRDYEATYIISIKK